jgi:hypothetical protein
MDCDNDLLQQLKPTQQKSTSSFKSLKSLAFFAAIFFIVVAAGAGGYLLGIRDKQPITLLQSTPSPQAPIITQSYPTITQLPNPTQNTMIYPTLIQFNPPAGWRVYKTEFGYQYLYPPTWNLYPESNAPSSSVSAPGAKYPGGRFIVERLPAKECERYLQSMPEWFISITKQQQIMISGYPASRVEGKSMLDDGYVYNRKSILVVRENTCYYLDITSRDDSEQLVILNQILSTFALTDFLIEE